MRELVKEKEDGSFELNLEYFDFFKRKVSMTWEDDIPTNPWIFSEKIGSEKIGSEKIGGLIVPLTS